jgi:hexosaminidase
MDMRILAAALAGLLAGGSAAPPPSPPQSSAPAASAAVTMPQLVPLPARIELTGGEPFPINASTVLQVTSRDAAVSRAARDLTEWIRRCTGLRLTGVPAAAAAGSRIEIGVDPAREDLGTEGYEIAIDPQRLALTARTSAGVFYGAQTIRQLLPYSAEYEAVLFLEPRPLTLPALRIVDTPRYVWRGAMLDVARHFFTVDEVKRFVDLLALHKMNRLHLHLSDDQGWRIAIRKWKDLTLKGGRTEVGGTTGGFYTQAEYKDLIAYAAERFITIVPEIDMPGHTNAALSSYAELNCDGRAPQPFTGTEVGFSSLCVDEEVTYRFIDDVVGEIAALTPGPYFHMGGDEVKTLKPEQYRAFVERVQKIVQKHGKEMIGWDEIAPATLLPTTIVQHWRPDAAKADLARLPRLIMSPADRTYLDMKYDADTALGLRWAALIPVRAAYEWDPAAVVPGLPASAVLGVEAPLWSETLASMRDAEFMALPRLSAAAEIAWSPQDRRTWDDFRVRLGAQAPRWAALGLNFYRSPDVPWR